MDIAQLMGATISGAMIVTFGGFYAGFFALGRLRNSVMLIWLAHASYVVLAAASWGLATNLGLEGVWAYLVPCLLLGYFIAPRMIWRLCVATHGDT
jgi:hypothetical protein